MGEANNDKFRDQRIKNSWDFFYSPHKDKLIYEILKRNKNERGEYKLAEMKALILFSNLFYYIW